MSTPNDGNERFEQAPRPPGAEPPSEPQPGPAEPQPGPAEPQPGPAEPQPGPAEPQPGPGISAPGAPTPPPAEPLPNVALPPVPPPAVPPALGEAASPERDSLLAEPAVRILFVVSVVLLVAVLLLSLMVFAPRTAPLKLGATRLAAEALLDRAVEEVAARFANNFLTIDYRRIDEDFNRILADATGSFERQLRSVLEVSRDRLLEAEASSTGTVTEVSVLSRRGDTASVRVVARRTISNVDTPDPRTVVQSLEVTLVHTAQGWKVADAAQLPSPSVPTGENP